MSKLEKPKIRLVIKTPIEILRDRKVAELLKSMSGEAQSGAAINLRLPTDLKEKLIDIAEKYKMPYGLIIRAVIREFLSLDEQNRGLFLAGRLKNKNKESREAPAEGRGSGPNKGGE